MDEIMEPAERLGQANLQGIRGIAGVRELTVWPCATRHCLLGGTFSDRTLQRGMQSLCNIQGDCDLAAGIRHPLSTVLPLYAGWLSLMFPQLIG